MNFPVNFVKRALCAGMAGALFGGLFDGVLGGSVGGWTPFLAALGLWAPLSIPLAFAGAVGGWALGWRAIRSPLQWVISAGWPRFGALAMVSGLMLVGILIGTNTLISFSQDSLRDQNLVGPVVALSITILVSTLGLTLIILRFPLERLLVWGGRIAGIIATLTALGLITVAIWPLAATLAKDVTAWPVVIPLLALAVTLWLGAVLTPPKHWVIGVWAIGMLALSIVGVQRYTHFESARTALGDARGFVPLWVGGIQMLTDRDGDGYSVILAGGDCDDTDGSINPLAFEIPGNGIDEDCVDGDAKEATVGRLGRARHYAVPKKLQKKWNFLIVTIDAMRPDHTSLYGYDRDTTPNLKALAEHALIFDRAYTPANATRFALPVMFGGRALADMDMDRIGRYLYIRDGNALITERLQKAGWWTEAHISQQLIEGMWFGLNAGFDLYKGHKSAKLKRFSVRPLTQGIRKAIQQRAGRPHPWMMWVHYLEPHEPYMIHRKFDYGPEKIDHYDAEIKASDAALGELLAMLDETGQRENTIVIVTSDHGEEFGEHGRKYHGKQLFEESIRIPLVIAIPGIKSQRFPGPVTLIDLAETIANFAGIPPGPEYGAKSLVSVLNGEAIDPNRPIFVECIRDIEHPKARQMTMIKGDHKVIFTLKKNQSRSFDLKADPLEQTNLRESNPDLHQSLLDELNKERVRQEHLIFKRAIEQRVTHEPPAGLTETPKEISPGLTWLTTKVERWAIGGRPVYRLRTWLKASGPQRSDLLLRVQMIDEKEELRRTKTYRPLAGMYPTHRWEEGEIIEDNRLLRFPKRFGTIRIEISVLRGKKIIYGPIVAGELSAKAGE